MLISRLALRASCALALPAQFACNDPGPEECDREVTLEVAVSAGKPTFDWVPDCSLHSLTVLDAADRSVWSIETPDDRNTLEPPVVYGEAPDGVLEHGPAAILQVGVTYSVRVNWIDRSDGRVILRFGDERAFIP